MSTASSAGTLRVQVWRKLKSLGALYLQQSVCLLPARSQVHREVRRLAARVRDLGGTARIMSITLTDPVEEHAVIAELNDARNREYSEVLERLPELRAELDRELAAGNASYAEVEESEADLARFRSWLTKIEARDYFAASGGQAARDAVEQASAALAAFEEAALAADTANTMARDQDRRLRVVDEP